MSGNHKTTTRRWKRKQVAEGSGEREGGKTASCSFAFVWFCFFIHPSSCCHLLFLLPPPLLRFHCCWCNSFRFFCSRAALKPLTALVQTIHTLGASRHHLCVRLCSHTNQPQFPRWISFCLISLLRKPQRQNSASSSCNACWFPLGFFGFQHELSWAPSPFLPSFFFSFS